MQWLAAGHHGHQIWATCEQVGDQPGRANDLLEVVQQQQAGAFAQHFGNYQPQRLAARILDTDCLSDASGHHVGVLDTRQIDEVNAALQKRGEAVCRRQRQASLACTPGPGQGEQTHAIDKQQIADTAQVSLAPEQRGRDGRQLSGLGSASAMGSAARRLVRLRGHGSGADPANYIAFSAGCRRALASCWNVQPARPSESRMSPRLITLRRGSQPGWAMTSASQGSRVSAAIGAVLCKRASC